MSSELNKAISTLVEELDQNIPNREFGQPYFSDPRYTPYPLATKNFKELTHNKIARKICFIDGGNLEIFGGANFSVQYNRLYFCIFDEYNKRVQPQTLPSKIEFISATYAKREPIELYYNTIIVPISYIPDNILPKVSDLEFNSFDRTLCLGIRRANISHVGSMTRRFCEWSFASAILKDELSAGDILVRDGSLQTAITNESIYSDHAYEMAEETEVILSGLSKTSNLFTSTGLSLLGAIAELANIHELQRKAWFYYPVAHNTQPDHKASIFIVKLHSESMYTFRYEIYRNQAEKMNKEEIMSVIDSLAYNSRDIAFPGYPYGLIEADKNARVAYQEIEGFRVLFFSEISKQKKWLKFANHIRTRDAHSILNEILR